MATINPTVAWVDDNTVKFTYTPMANGDVGAPIGPNHMEFADRNVVVSGTFGAGGTATIQGSSDGASSYQSLNDQSDNALAITTAKNEQILQIAENTRPSVAGDGSTALTVIILCRRQRPKR